jgi:chromosome segregation ATPase
VSLPALSLSEQRLSSGDFERRVAFLPSLQQQSKAHRARIESLKKKLSEKNEDFEVAKAKQEISEWTSAILQKNVDELRESKERYYEKSLDCAKKLKDSFAKVGAYSSEYKFIRGDPEGIIEWISDEAEAFDEILSDCWGPASSPKVLQVKTPSAV